MGEIINTDDYFYEITDEGRGTIGYGCVSYKTAELIRRIHKQNKQLKRLEQETAELKAENERLKEENDGLKSQLDFEIQRRAVAENATEQLEDKYCKLVRNYKELQEENARLKECFENRGELMLRGVKQREQLKEENDRLKSQIKDLQIRKDQYYLKGLEQERQISDYITLSQEIKTIAGENKDTVQYGGICRSILDLITKVEEQ